ncbi:hypothetical protein GOB93_17810 [Acetobacter musti]|uniref:Uncharacterized protein n=1 Tax=Acetobacter musti TaxID=864732 RepID=A0ABX0JU25_9PROT|nr:hypothetical protein [Acetobacter musti]NHN86475.1 hypothetical protein [Acetobacter musti]
MILRQLAALADQFLKAGDMKHAVETIDVLYRVSDLMDAGRMLRVNVPNPADPDAGQARGH